MRNIHALLHEEYQRQKSTPFAWGQSDCACTAADFVKAIIGRDVMAHLRGTYDNEFGAKRIMVERGWSDMAAFAASVFTEIHVGQARSGDWIHITNDDGTDGLGVVCGAQAIVRTQEGIGLVTLSRAKRAFRVV